MSKDERERVARAREYCATGCVCCVPCLSELLNVCATIEHARVTRVLIATVFSYKAFLFLVPVLFGLFGYFLSVCMPVCMLLDAGAVWTAAGAALSVWPRPCRELPRLEHRISRGHSHVSGRGCFHCFCDDGSLLQVSCSTQKLLPVPQVSEQNEPGSLTYTLFWIALPYVTLPTYLYLSLLVSCRL